MKERKPLHFCLQEISQDDISKVQLIRTGKFNHAYFGKFDITEEVLRSFKLNFDRNARGVDIAVDYFHESHQEAAGWIKEIELRENDTQLWITVDWTDKAKEKILGKEIRYISADFDLDYSDSETGEEFGATLYGAGLTNRPHVKNMQPVFSDEIIEQNPSLTNKIKDKTMPTFDEILASVSDLSEDEKLQLGEKLGFTVKASELTEVKAQLAEAQKSKTTKEDSVKQLSDEVKSLKADLAKKAKEVEFTSMLTNGSVVEAQRAAFMEGNMTEFAKNAVSVKLEEKGVGTDDDASESAEAKLTEIAESKVKDQGVSFSEAMKAAVKENPALAEKANA